MSSLMGSGKSWEAFSDTCCLLLSALPSAESCVPQRFTKRSPADDCVGRGWSWTLNHFWVRLWARFLGCAWEQLCDCVNHPCLLCNQPADPDQVVGCALWLTLPQSTAAPGAVLRCFTELGYCPFFECYLAKMSCTPQGNSFASTRHLWS